MVSKPKAATLSPLLVFLFSSLLLILVACHGLSLVSLPIDPPLPQQQQEQPVAIPRLFPHHLQYSEPVSNPKVSSRRTHKHKFKLKILSRHDDANANFSARLADFFSSSSSCPCAPRFFMTWISPLRSFGPRELLSVESLFRSHPDACLLVLSRSLDCPAGEDLLRPLSRSGFRVAAVAPDFGSLLRGTPAERWFARLRRGEVDPGHVPIGQNLSNLLRLAALYQYGGVYVDADVIVLRSVLGLRNAIGAQAVDPGSGNWTRLNNAVMAFDRRHPLLREFIREFAGTFDGSKWGHNGPYLVSRVAMRVLAGTEREEVRFDVLPPAAFYPVDWSRIEGLFRGPRGGPHSRWVSAKLQWIRKRSFTVHLWNRQSSGLKAEEGSIIGRIMSDCCLFCNSSAAAAAAAAPASV